MMRQISFKAMVIGLTFGCFSACADDPPNTNSQADSPNKQSEPASANILFLHHSTGQCIWDGGVGDWFDAYNRLHNTRLNINERNFPKDAPYGWENYPFDYWNIWVRHAGDRPYKAEPTLEILTPKYDTIVFKHCFPVSSIEPDFGEADVASPDKRIENYKLQYAALKNKLHEFPQTKFILWTAAALIRNETDKASAQRAQAFVNWVIKTWDEPGDNIYLWDFNTLETEGGLYLPIKFSSGDSHPNEHFSQMAAPLFCQRVVDVINGSGDTGDIIGRGGKPIIVQPDNEPEAESDHEPQMEPDPAHDEPTPVVTPDPPTHSPPSPDAWIFDDAEDAQHENQLWGQDASYVDDGDNHAIQIRFAEGREEDWGEYGRQMIVTTKAPAKNFDVKPFRYVAFRVKTDRDMELVFTLITKPDSLPRSDHSYFGFSAYPQLAKGDWKWVVLDLTKLELGAEGEKAYATASKPIRPMKLTYLMFVTNKKNEAADLLIDDIVFYRTLPASLTDFVE